MASTGNCIAQPIVLDPSSTQRNIEQSLESLQREVAPIAHEDIATGSYEQTDTDIDKLVGIELNIPEHLSILSSQIDAYWMNFLEKPVSGFQITDFKAWLWEQLQRQGYLGYISIQTIDHTDGSSLLVAVQAPLIGQTTVLTADAEDYELYARIVAQRFSQAYPIGAAVDVQGIEAQLNAIAYDLPFNLQASLRQVGIDTIDVIINLQRIDQKLGNVINAVVQFNNYGLKPYGREQMLGVVRLAGPRPLSEFTGVALVSKGVNYVRGDYSQPIEGWATRWNLYGSTMRSKANTDSDFAKFSQRGKSNVIGGGLTTLLNTSRNGSWNSVLEVSHRLTEGNLSIQNVDGRTPTSDRRDNQLRVGLVSDHKMSFVDRFTTETTLTFGHLSLKSDDISYNQPDANKYLKGRYQRLEHRGSLFKALPADDRWTFITRWQAQVASQNMDSYNKISLGGVNGIRAFDSDEGLGDQGVLVSFDLIRKLNTDIHAGIFYDVGRVQANRRPTSNSYSLQGTGVSLGGNVHTWFDWTLSVAKSHGSRPPEGNINSKIGDWRAFFAANWRY